ncbi:MAG: HAMP domain-containing protein [Candidatus Omnitrophota bacterium]|nr:MAG: HAMP domain-containing protein [Candidatus Omnitrophota bacterium]
MKISQKLILVFIGIVLAFVIAAQISINISRQALEETIGENSAMLTREIMDKIDRNIYHKIELMQIYTKDLILQDALIKSNEEFGQIENIEEYINQKDEEWVATPAGKLNPFIRGLIDNRASEELIEKINFLEEKYDYRVFSEIFAANKYGAVAALTQKTSDYYQADEQWWQAAKEEGVHVGDIEYDRSAAVYSIDICIRVEGEAGDFLGVLKAVLNIEEIVSTFKELIFAGSTYRPGSEMSNFKLITGDGRVIFSTEPGFEIFERLGDQIIANFEKEEEHLDYFVVRELKDKGREKLFSHSHSKGYRDYKGVGWTLVIEHDTEEVFAPVNKLSNILWGISGIVVIVAFLVGFFIFSAIVMPLREITYAAQEVGGGKLDVKIEVKSKDEVGQLANSFNKMTSDLRKAQNEIKNGAKLLGQKVEERTKELTAVNEEQKEIKQELEKKVDQLQRFNKAAVGREMKMIELKKEIQRLEEELKAYKQGKKKKKA